jgi:hypothetical protein
LGKFISLLACAALLLPGVFFLFPEGKKSTAPFPAAMPEKHTETILPDFALLQTGDLIVRHGKGFISEALMKFSRNDSRYSHAGFIVMENNAPFVYHAIGGEENKSNKLRKDPLSYFCMPGNAEAYGIYRYNLTPEQKPAIARRAEEYFRAGLEFDLSFDLKSDSAMYCTEFIYKIITAVTGNGNYISLSSVNNTPYVALDNLYLNSHALPVFSHRYPE